MCLSEMLWSETRTWLIRLRFMEAGKCERRQKRGTRAGVRQELLLGRLRSPLCVPEAPWHEAQILAKDKTRWSCLQLLCQPLQGWAARECQV